MIVKADGFLSRATALCWPNVAVMAVVMVGALGLIALLSGAPSRAESYTVSDGYAAKPDNDPFHYFPTRPYLRESMEEMAEDLNRYANITRAVRDVVLDEIGARLDATEYFFAANVTIQAFYETAIEARDCRLAKDLVWRQWVEERPFMVGLRDDSAFDRELTQLYQNFFPALAACLYAQDARTLSLLIARHSEVVTGTRTLVRPFQHHQSWFSGLGTLHGGRDWNYWQLIEMATDPSRQNYGPAGVMLVELALEIDSLDLPDDILHMLLLRGEATWPDDARPLPVTRERIAELLPITAARLSADERARAEQCFLTNEPYQRLFMGEAAYFAEPQSDDCVASAP